MDRGIGHWLYRNADINRGRPALAEKARRVTYDELNERTNRLASALHREGVRRGDRVAILGTNSIAWLEMLFAVAKVGAISVPLNFRLSPRELAYNLQDSGATVLAFSSTMQALTDDTLADESVRVRQTIELDSPEYEELIAAGDPTDRDDDVRPDDDALILYTSGTTGRPKGAVISHGAVQANSVHALLMGLGMSRYDVTVTPAPLFHVGGLAVHTLPLLYAGGLTYLLQSFDPAEMLATMSREGATLQFLVPSMWADLTRVPDFDSYDLSAFRFALSGGAPCPLPVIEFLQGHGWMFLEGFGMTETTANTMILDGEHSTVKRGSVGRPVIEIDAAVFGDDDKPVPTGTVGELVLRGPTLFRGYWGLPAATEEAYRSGWFHTGDLAKIDEDGFYHLVDRKKDMVISGGENIYPVEVEQVIYGHPNVQEVAVIGVPDEKWGETVVAVVVPKDPASFDADELVDFTRQHLARFKCPRRVEVVSEMPRTATGKLLKRNLRERYAGTSSAVHR